MGWSSPQWSTPMAGPSFTTDGKRNNKSEIYFLSSRFNFKLKYLVYVNIVKILQKTFFFSWNKGIKDYFNWVMIDEYL